MPVNPDDAYDLFSRHYIYLSFFASLGTLQLASSFGGYRALWITPWKPVTRWLGGLLIVGGFALFFLQPLWVDGPWEAGSVDVDSSIRLWGKADWGDLGKAHNVNDVDGGLAATAQGTWFPLGAGLALAFAIVAGGIRQLLFASQRRSARAGAPAEGLDGLKDGTYLSTFIHSWRVFRRTSDRDAEEAIKAADGWSIPILARRALGR